MRFFGYLIEANFRLTMLGIVFDCVLWAWDLDRFLRGMRVVQ